MGPNQTYKLLCIKENHKYKQTEKTKRQPTEWEKIVSNDAIDKGLISKYTSNSYYSIAKKKNKKNKQTTQPKDRQKT